MGVLSGCNTLVSGQNGQKGAISAIDPNLSLAFPNLQVDNHPINLQKKGNVMKTETVNQWIMIGANIGVITGQ